VTLNLEILDRLPSVGAGFSWRTHPGATAALHPSSGHARAAFTTRLGGVCPPPLDGLNISWSIAAKLGVDGSAGTGIDDLILTNREIAARTICPDWPMGQLERWFRVRQVHGSTAVRASRTQRDADAVWTDDPHRLVAVTVADCVPVLLAAPGRVAAVHAGWRGMVGGVIGNAAEAMGGATEAFAGPAIGPCCFEVGPEVVQAFRDRFGEATVADERHVDLWAAAEVAFGESGIGRFAAARLCTSCHADLFFSHRRDNGRTGRQALVACLETR
jgi:polyphenol oxidase